MGRPRKKGNKDLPTGLYRDSATGVFYIKWKGKQLSLETKDKKEALELYAIVRAKWEEQDLEKQATRIAARLKRIIVVGRDKSFADYCAYWRKKVLPRATKKNGKPLAPKTRGDYGRMLRYQVEPSEHFATGLSEVSAKLG